MRSTMKTAFLALLGFGIIGFTGCDSNSGELEDGQLSANRLIEVPATAASNEAAVEVEVGPLPVLNFGESVFDFGSV